LQSIDGIVSYATYSTLLYIWMAIGVVTFFYLLKVPAPFGRHTSLKWGMLIDNRLGWFIMEATVLFTFWLQAYPIITQGSVAEQVMAALFTLHYLNRAVIFPFRLHTKGKKMPVAIMFSAIAFNLVNGSALGYYFSHYADYPAAWMSRFGFIAGVLLFFSGMIINWSADNYLIHLRKKSETGYQIPRGNLFKQISCPNHAGEILEWGGYALLCWNLPALAFFVWTAANLVPRALAHHRWYKQHFEDYPKERTALIPFLL
jgi:hypothetical protein